MKSEVRIPKAPPQKVPAGSMYYDTSTGQLTILWGGKWLPVDQACDWVLDTLNRKEW